MNYRIGVAVRRIALGVGYVIAGSSTAASGVVHTRT